MPPHHKRASRASWKPSLTFISLNILPVAVIVYYLKTSIDERRQELAKMGELSTLPPNDVARRIESICNACSSSSLVLGTLDSCVVVPILPHSFEDDTVIFSSEDLVANIEHSIPGTSQVFDAVTATRQKCATTPLNFVHFAVSASSPVCAQLANKNRKLTIVYNGGPVSDVAVTIHGTAVVVDDPRVKQYYWRDKWHSIASNKNEYILIKFSPSEVKLASLNCHQEVALIRKDSTEWTRAVPS